MSLCSPSATWLSRINTVYCLHGEKIQPAFEIHPMRYKQWRCTHWNKNATQFSFAYAATTDSLKPCHVAAGGTQVSGSLPAGHCWHLSSCSIGTQLGFCVLGVFTILGNCGRHGSDITLCLLNKTCVSCPIWASLSSAIAPLWGDTAAQAPHHYPQPEGNLSASVFLFCI